MTSGAMLASSRQSGHNLVLALCSLREACLLSRTYLTVPFTNNGVE